MIEQLPLPHFRVERKFFPWTEDLLGKESGEVYTAFLRFLTPSATRVLLHEYKPDRFIPVGIQEVIDAQGRLEQLVCLTEGCALGFTSAVETKTGKIEHLLLLDYDCAKTAENLLKITMGLDQLGELNHVVLETENSFHSIRIGPDRRGINLVPRDDIDKEIYRFDKILGEKYGVLDIAFWTYCYPEWEDCADRFVAKATSSSLATLRVTGKPGIEGSFTPFVIAQLRGGVWRFSDKWLVGVPPEIKFLG